jgi:hypothetical protein
MHWLRAFAARGAHYVHDLCMFSCLAFFEGHWAVLTLAGLGVTAAIITLSLFVWREIE